jgi:hypothetical protein
MRKPRVMAIRTVARLDPAGPARTGGPDDRPPRKPRARQMNPKCAAMGDTVEHHGEFIEGHAL